MIRPTRLPRSNKDSCIYRSVIYVLFLDLRWLIVIYLIKLRLRQICQFQITVVVIMSEHGIKSDIDGSDTDMIISRTDIFMFGGGMCRYGDASPAVRVYSPSHKEPRRLPDLSTPRMGAVAVSAGRYIVVLGGFHGEREARKDITTIDVFDTYTYKWRCDANLLDATLGTASGGREGAAAVTYLVLADITETTTEIEMYYRPCVFVTGGRYMSNDITGFIDRKCCFAYFYYGNDPVPNPDAKLLRLPDMNMPRVGHALVVYDGKPVAIGGVCDHTGVYHGTDVCLAEKFDENKMQWLPFEPPPPLYCMYDRASAVVIYSEAGQQVIYMVAGDSFYTFAGYEWTRISMDPLHRISHVYRCISNLISFSESQKCIVVMNRSTLEWERVVNLADGDPHYLSAIIVAYRYY